MQVLTTAESNKDLIRIDALQRLHTLTNLSELLESGVQGIAHTLRDDQLQKQAEEIRQASARPCVTSALVCVSVAEGALCLSIPVCPLMSFP